MGQAVADWPGGPEYPAMAVQSEMLVAPAGDTVSIGHCVTRVEALRGWVVSGASVAALTRKT